MFNLQKVIPMQNKKKEILLNTYRGFKVVWEFERVYSEKSKFFEILIGNNKLLGTFLALNEDIQSSEYDSYIFHEMLVHPAMCIAKNPRRILLIGNGEGAAILEILKHSSVKEVVWVDIDRKLVEVSSKMLPYAWKGVDKRVVYIEDDGYNFLKKANLENKKFDVIILDVTRVSGTHETKLFGKNTTRLINSVMHSGSVLITVPGILFPDSLDKSRINKAYSTFKYIRRLSFFMPSFLGIQRFFIATMKNDPYSISKKIIRRKIDKLNGTLQYYDENSHFSSMT